MSSRTRAEAWSSMIGTPDTIIHVVATGLRRSEGPMRSCAQGSGLIPNAKRRASAMAARCD